MTSKRRGKGDGSVVKRKDGRWMGRYWVTNSFNIKEQRAVYGKTQAEVDSKLREATRMARLNQDINKPTGTLEQFYHYWLEVIAPNELKQTTIAMYDWYFRKWILPSLGKRKLNKITVQDIQLMIHKMKEKTQANRSCQICRDVLSSVLHCAVDQDMLMTNPARKVKVPKYERKEKIILDDNELKVFLKNAEATSPYALTYKLLACCGLRIGEVLGLRKKDIDFENLKLHISQQIVLIKNHPTATKPKTKTSTRMVDFPNELYAELSNLVNTLQDESSLLFHTRSGRAISPNNLRRDFRKVNERAKVKKITPHSLRHMYCTRSLRDDVGLKSVQENLGHSSPQVTIGVYQHSTDKDRNAIARSMSSILAY